MVKNLSNPIKTMFLTISIKMVKNSYHLSLGMFFAHTRKRHSYEKCYETGYPMALAKLKHIR